MDISIITINFNNSKLTLDFVSSLSKHIPSDLEYEIIIVDNKSSAKELDILTENLGANKKITIHKSRINTGFGGGNMLGVNYASGKYLAFINNDVIITEDCFSPLIEFLEKNKTAGVCTPQQYNDKNEAVTCFDYYHDLKYKLFGPAIIELFKNRNVPKRYNIPYKKKFAVDFVQGCFMFFEKDKFNQIGGFDTNIFLYYEEMDTCLELNKNGYSAHVVPSSRFTHIHGGSTKQSIAIKREIFISHLYVFSKHYSLLSYFILRVYLLLIFSLKTIIKPKYYKHLLILISGNPLKYSLKQKQSI